VNILGEIKFYLEEDHAYIKFSESKSAFSIDMVFVHVIAFLINISLYFWGVLLYKFGDVIPYIVWVDDHFFRMQRIAPVQS